MMDIEAMLELPAGRELDRVVAEALGWTNIEETVYWIDDYDGSEEITAWEGVPPDTHSTRLVPRHSTDANAALELVSDDPYFSLRRILNEERGNSWEALHWHREEEAPTPALAIVRAWLAYRKADTP